MYEQKQNQSMQLVNALAVDFDVFGTFIGFKRPSLCILPCTPAREWNEVPPSTLKAVEGQTCLIVSL